MQTPRRTVDFDGAFAESELDFVLRIEIRPAQQNAVFRRRALQIGFGERRALIGKILLIAEQDELAVISLLAQRGRKLHAAVSGADDDNLVRTHPSLLC